MSAEKTDRSFEAIVVGGELAPDNVLTARIGWPKDIPLSIGSVLRVEVRPSDPARLGDIIAKADGK